MTFVRFVIEELDSSSGRRQGVFQAIAELRRSGMLTKDEEDDAAEAWSWFSERLDKPARLGVSRRPHAKAQAIGWFKTTAVAHIQRVRVFERILEAHGVSVSMLRTGRPGYIVFEDEFQIAAYPFGDTPN